MRSVRTGVFGTVADMSTFYTEVDIGKRLRDERKLNRYTIKELAVKLKTTENVIEAWEDGLSLPSDEFVKKLSKIYDVDEFYLLGLVEDKRKRNNYEIQ